MNLFFQDYLEKFFASMLSIIKVLFFSKLNLKIKKIESEYDSIILGNGPSLKDTLIDDIDFLLEVKNKVFAVNSFAVSEYYKKIKPCYYVLNAPEYWIEKISDLHVNLRNEVFQSIKKVTDWELTLLVPHQAKKSRVWKGLFDNNPNIKIVYYNKTPVEGLDSVNHFLFRKNLGMPRPYNVLIPSIFLALNMGFKKIILFGADHSWHEEIKIDSSNKVTVNHEHFYDKAEVRLPMYKLNGQEYHIHDMFRKFYLSFKGYFVLRNYAYYLDANIYNASKRSYIDAFPKIVLNED